MNVGNNYPLNQKLHIACQQKKLEEVKNILNSIPQEHIALQDHLGHTPLHYIALNGNFKIAKLLIKQMTPNEISIQDNDGMTSLHYACLLDHHEIKQLLRNKMTEDQIVLKDYRYEATAQEIENIRVIALYQVKK
jgi:ankyrin repeat protein